jgi:AraC-like DNA-binding protein
MPLLTDERNRPSDSPYIEAVMAGRTIGEGTVIRPSESHWHMVFVKLPQGVHPIFVAPLTTSGTVNFYPGAEILWVKFKLGTFMPHLPAKKFLDVETYLPTATTCSFWLKGSAWQFPDFNNVETFINRLAHADILTRDPLVEHALTGQLPNAPERTVRHRFLQATGLTHTYIRQMQRAQYADALLQQGLSILDTVHEAGYYDQPHLTRALKRFIGKTPAQQLARACAPDPLFEQNTVSDDAVWSIERTAPDDAVWSAEGLAV